MTILPSNRAPGIVSDGEISDLGNVSCTLVMMQTPSLFARHEAAHAIAAVYLKLPLLEITIVQSKVEDRELGGYVRLAEVPNTPERNLAIAVAAFAARVETDRFKWTEDIPDFIYATDERLIREAAKRMNVADEKYEEWRAIVREITSRVLDVGWVTDAIDGVAYELDRLMTVAPETVEKMADLYRGGHPKALHEMWIDDAFIERIQKLGDELGNH